MKAAQPAVARMPVEFNHTIIRAREPASAADFLASILGLPEPRAYGPFLVVSTSNGVDLDVMQADGDVTPQHYAFLVGEQDFDAIFARIRARGIDYWADPGRQRAGTINHADGGRGVYFDGPDGHFLEIITRRYGSGD